MNSYTAPGIVGNTIQKKSTTRRFFASFIELTVNIKELIPVPMTQSTLVYKAYRLKDKLLASGITGIKVNIGVHVTGNLIVEFPPYYEDTVDKIIDDFKKENTPTE